VQHFPAALRSQESQLELLPDEGAPGGGEFVLPYAPQALDLVRLQNPVPLARRLRSLDPLRRALSNEKKERIAKLLMPKKIAMFAIFVGARQVADPVCTTAS
jgi:hypothetical protein